MRWIITAPKGSFATITKAAQGEDRLDWMAAIGPDHDACTLSFAATECAESLAKLEAVQADLLTWDGKIPAGCSITILSPAWLADHRKAVEKVFGKLEIPATGQSFTIRAAAGGKKGSPRYLVLGGSRVGALYGTYELLNRLGFSWLGPDACDTVVPDALSEDLPAIDVTQSPSFTVRGYWIGTRRGGKDFLLWMARNRMNLWSLADPNKPTCRKLGMLFCSGWHGDFGKFVPPEKFFKTHPEWYSLIDGKRSTHFDHDNLCLSQPGCRQQFAKGMLEFLIRGRDAWTDLMNVVPADGGRWCECDDCRQAGNPTDLVMLLLHDCRQAVREAYAQGKLNRDVIIGMIAYLETKAAPTRPLPPDFDHAGTMMTFFPIERCYSHNFADDACSDINAVIRDCYEGWTRNPACSFHGQTCIGEYYNVSKFAGLAIPFMKRMAADIPYYYRTGARALHYMHVVVSDWGTLSLTNMQLSAQLWDHQLDCWAWLDGFLATRYGEHAAAMRDFYCLLEEAMANVQVLKHQPNFNAKDHIFHTLRIPGDPKNPVEYLRARHFQYDGPCEPANDGPSMVQTLELLDMAKAILDHVVMQAEDPLVRRRLQADSRRFYYTRNMMHFYYHIIRLRMLENQGNTVAAGLEARYLRDIGEALRKEDLVTRNGCQDSVVLFSNGLMSTWLSQAYIQIMKTYGLAVEPVEFDGVV